MFGNKRFATWWTFLVSEFVNLLIGVGFGVLLFSTVAFVPLIFGNLTIVELKTISFQSILDIFSLFQPSFQEELWIRLFIFGLIYRKWSFHIATMVSASIFSIFHLFNPGANFVSTIGIFSVGIFLAALIARYSSLGLNTGVHWGWNFSQGVLWGLPVSGLDKFSNHSFIKSQLVGDSVFTGGSFGLESALPTILIISILAIYFYVSAIKIEKENGSKPILFVKGFSNDQLIGKA